MTTHCDPIKRLFCASSSHLHTDCPSFPLSFLPTLPCCIVPLHSEGGGASLALQYEGESACGQGFHLRLYGSQQMVRTCFRWIQIWIVCIYPWFITSVSFSLYVACVTEKRPHYLFSMSCLSPSRNCLLSLLIAYLITWMYKRIHSHTRSPRLTYSAATTPDRCTALPDNHTYAPRTTSSRAHAAARGQRWLKVSALSYAGHSHLMR